MKVLLAIDGSAHSEATVRELFSRSWSSAHGGPDYFGGSRDAVDYGPNYGPDGHPH